MKIGTIGAVILFMVIMAAGPVAAQERSEEFSMGGWKDYVTPITNEISYYKNTDDLGRSRGTTLQIISINAFHVLTDFTFEFTGDFNWEMDFSENYDYYLELSLVKPVYKSLSINYQRIYGTFVGEPINQVGLRISLFSGS